MNIDLGILNNGSVMLVSNPALPHIVKRVEYYQAQRLMMIVYDHSNGDQTDDLIDYEVPQRMSHRIEQSPDVMIYSLFKDHEPIGYKAPLIKIDTV